MTRVVDCPHCGSWEPGVSQMAADGYHRQQDRLVAAEARLREVEAERDRLQEWTDRVAQTSTDAATAAEKAEARVAELEALIDAIQNGVTIVPNRETVRIKGRITEIRKEGFTPPEETL